ncbi:MAG: zinc-binding alcohol dehydrogenase family protein [Flavisolibacter sp.]
MRSLICTSPRQLDYTQIVAPESAKGQSIIKIRRIGICGTDLHAFEGTQPFFSYPRILGHELAGEFMEGEGAIGFERGEAVTVIPYFNCGFCIACHLGKPNCCSNIQVCGVHINGGMAEYLSVPSWSLVHGEGLSFDELALVEPFAIGAHAIGRSQVMEGEFVLVIGAGPIGLGIMEFARMGGGRVIALDINDSKLKFCKDKLNPAHTLNANNSDIREQLLEITNGNMATVVIDASGNLGAINKGFEYMAHGGRYILVGLQKEEIRFSHPEFHKREATLMSSRNATKADFQIVIDSIKKGLICPTNFISHYASFEKVKKEFDGWLNPSNGVVKAMVKMDNF